MAVYRLTTTTKILQIFLIQCFPILIYLLLKPTRATGHSKTLIDNTFYNKPILNITAGKISSVISDHLILVLIELFATNAKLKQICKLQRYYKNSDKTKFEIDLHKMERTLQ